MKKYLIGGLLCVVVLAACQRPKPAPLDPAPFISAGNQFMKGISQGEIQTTYEQWVSPGAKFNPQFSLSQFTADWQSILEKFGAFKKVVLVAYQQVPGRKVVQLYYQVTQANAREMTYHLVTEEDTRGRRGIFLIDIGNDQAYPMGGQPGEKILLSPPIQIVP